jgi:hypothetical protein
LFRLKMKKKLNLKDPQTFNEKLQWLKLYDRNPSYIKMVDKIAVKDYIAKVIGPEVVIPTLGIWEHYDNIDFDSLPNQFVLKTNHSGGNTGVVICKDKGNFDYENAKRKLELSLKKRIYPVLKEWPYKNVQPRIFAEKYLEDESGELRDYKVLCFNGKAKLIECHSNRFAANHTQDFYDITWNKTSITQTVTYSECSSEIIKKPVCLERMIRYSELLVQNIVHCRVDWYIVNDVLYFGEMTFYDGSGLCGFDKDSDDLMLGSWINLDKLEKSCHV